MKLRDVEWIIHLVCAIVLIVCAIISLASCSDPDPPMPTCADLGCSHEPSGSDEIWIPCEGDVCFCGVPAEACTP